MRKHVPNIITLLNLLAGCVAVYFAAIGALHIAAYLVMLGIVLDFFDGLMARALRVRSPLGVQLDSLADMVTSGLAPGMVVFQLFLLSLGLDNGDVYTDATTETMRWIGVRIPPLPFMAFLIPLSSAYRLAKFNIDSRQTTYFIGLPTPANALAIVSLPLILWYQGSDLYNQIITCTEFLVGITLFSSFMLNAPIKLFSLKSKGTGLRENATPYVFLLLSVVCLVMLHFAAIPLIVVLYIVMSLLDDLVLRFK